MERGVKFRVLLNQILKYHPFEVKEDCSDLLEQFFLFQLKGSSENKKTYF